ncbi:MAG TPA: hypothetical protein VM639_11590 [Dongiaceae bacterium]|nr:hypothetical protein [Dongiaceae bacterium]
MIGKAYFALCQLVQKQLRSFGKDATLILFSRVLQNVNGFLLSIAIIRKFGLAAAGSLTISTIGTVILATFLTFGLPYVFARTQSAIRVRNAIGLLAGVTAMVISLPVCAALGFGFSKDMHEALVIAVLSLGGAFFAQTTIANALLVLQDQAVDIIFSPVGNLVGLALGYFLTDDFLHFALIVTLCRFLGTAIIFARLPYGHFTLAELKTHVRQGLGFLTADTIGLIADQVSVMIASALMSRADLGIFGLCRQMLTVGDTPAWSRLTAWYPRVVADPLGAAVQLRREMLRMGILGGLGLAAMAVPLGLWIYHLPSFILAACLMVICVPFRYVVGTCETSLRALGLISIVNQLTLIRCLLVVLLPAGILIGGLYGAIIATLAQILFLAWLTNSMLNKQLRKRRHAETPATADAPTIAGPGDIVPQVAQ